MKKISIYLIASLAPIAPAMATDFPTQRPQPVSQYGLIQNVQDYSSNPFWSQGSPYNQRMPSPVYVQGADLTAADCQAVVASVVAGQCAGRNNCAGVQLSTIRPTILTQLSQLPGYNYVTACAGFIDGAFNDYVSQYGTTLSGKKNFPAAVAPGNNAVQPEFKIANPYEPKFPTWNNEPWLGDIVNRTVELGTLQAQNSGGEPKLIATQMPKTIADLSFEERMQLTQEGYEQWAQNKAYQGLNVESDETFYQREAMLAPLKQAAGFNSMGGAGTNTADSELARRIAEALKNAQK